MLTTQLLRNIHLSVSGMMTARFLLHLRDWESQSTDKGEFSRSGTGTEINFKKTTMGDDEFSNFREKESEGGNGNGDGNNAGGGWKIHSEFGNDPVLEARMGCNASKGEIASLREIETRSPRVVNCDGEVCGMSSSTSKYGSKV